MTEENEAKTTFDQGSSRGFLATLAQDLARDALRFLLRSIIAFAIGTGAGAIVCWYYGIPLIFALIGGVLVLALVLFFSFAHVLD